MKSYEFDILIIGGGCIGSSVYHELGLQGFTNVALLDNGRKTLSATSKSGGMLRVFHERSQHIDLALNNLKRLEVYQKAGWIEKAQPNASLYFFNKHRYSSYEENLRKMDGAGYPFEVFNTVYGRERFPQFHWGDDEWAIYEPQSSQLSPQTFVEDLLTASAPYKNTILDSFEVIRICSYRDQFRVYSNDSAVTTKLLILAGGARLVPKLKDLGVSLPLETRTLTSYLAEKNQEDFVLPNYFDRETLQFGGFGPGRNVTLSNPLNQRLIEKKWSSTFTEMTAQDCYAPGRLGYIGEVPGHPRLILATGWGGTAFKFALDVGRQVAYAVERNLPDRRLIYGK
ncbi:MAG: FAD-binding oxidoreductase [Bdellovibrionota bacterium]